MTGRTMALSMAAAVVVAAAVLVATAPQPASAQGKPSGGDMLEGTATSGTTKSLIAGFDGPSGSARVILRTHVTNRGTTPPTVEVVAWPDEGDVSTSAVRRRVLSESMVSVIDLRPGEGVRVRCFGDAVVKWQLVEIDPGGH